MLVKDFYKEFSTLVGDGTVDIPEDFFINALNWAFRELPKVSKLDRVFTRHKHFNLDANQHYSWEINAGFRRLTDIGLLRFYSSTGGEPCPLVLCYKDPIRFYDKNGLVELKEPGIPCEYTIETEGDRSKLVIDRPSNVPIIVDIICCGYPMPVTSMEEEIELSAPVEQLILSAIQTVWYRELSDFGFADNIALYMDSKLVPEIIQLINRRWSMAGNAILGEV